MYTSVERKDLKKEVICMNIVVGDNRLENIAVRLSDVKVRDEYAAGNQQAQETLDLQAQKAASTGVVLEISKSGLQASNNEQSKAEAVDKVKDDLQEQQRQKAETVAIQNEQKKTADTQRVLENINI